MDKVLIVDYGVGNIASVLNMLKYVGAEGYVSGDADEVRAARKIILPGIGAFGAGMEALRGRGLEQPLKDAIKNGSYVLGICLGFQMLFESSEEWPGGTGIGLIKGIVRHFSVDQHGLRVPHVGWNEITPRPDAQLFTRDMEDLRYYFVHSFYADCQDETAIAATCHYGQDFVCAIEKDRVFGVQFHPEKSHRFGIDTFTRFVKLSC
jgi:glutamine amidotransferase